MWQSVISIGPKQDHACAGCKSSLRMPGKWSFPVARIVFPERLQQANEPCKRLRDLILDNLIGADSERG